MRFLRFSQKRRGTKGPQLTQFTLTHNLLKITLPGHENMYEIKMCEEEFLLRRNVWIVRLNYVAVLPGLGWLFEFCTSMERYGCGSHGPFPRDPLTDYSRVPIYLRKKFGPVSEGRFQLHCRRRKTVREWRSLLASRVTLAQLTRRRIECVGTRVPLLLHKVNIIERRRHNARKRIAAGVIIKEGELSCCLRPSYFFLSRFSLLYDLSLYDTLLSL